MLASMRRILLAATLWAAAARGAPAPQGDGGDVGGGGEGGPPPREPSVDSMTLFGPGCPVGSGGIVREVRDGTPVFLFTEWALDLAEAGEVGGGQEEEEEEEEEEDGGRGSVSKFCSEEIRLGNGPAGWQVRIAVVNVAGVATLEEGSRLGVGVVTGLGGVVGGSASATVTPLDLKAGGAWSVALATAPQEWSPCVGEDGKVPPITIRTTVSLNGTAVGEGGRLSGGTVGGAKTDLKKALSLHFQSRWRKCP